MSSNRAADRTYHEVDSFTLGEQWQFAADATHVAFGGSDGQVELVGRDGRETVSVSAPLDDIELERYLVSLSGDTVSAYTNSGVELWSQTVPGATDVVSLGEKDVLAVLTEDGRVVGLDLETGGELFSTQRPHDDFTDIYVAGGDGVLCIGAWSFVVCIDASGAVTVDQNLDSAVEDVSVLGGQVLAVLKEGTVVALDCMTGDEIWSNSASLRHLSPSGETWLPGLESSGAVLIHREGRLEQLPLETGQRIVATTDVGVIGVAGETSARLYRLGPPPTAQLTGEILTDRVSADTPIRAFVENTGDVPLETTVTLESSARIRVDSEYQHVELDPGESREIAYRLQELPPTDTFDCRLAVEENDLDTASIIVNRGVDLDEAVSIAATCTEVHGDSAVFQWTVENTADVPLDVPRLGETFPEESLPPGERITVDREFLLDGTERRLQIEIAHRNETRRIEHSITVPGSAIEVDISWKGTETPAVDVGVKPTVEVPIDGSLSVTVQETTLTRELTLRDNERLNLAVVLPPALAERDVVSVAVESPLLNERHQSEVDGWENVSAWTGTSGRQTEPASPQEEFETPSEQSLIEQVSQSRSEPSLTVERRVPETVEVGRLFTEKIRLTNDTGESVSEVNISDEFCQQSIEGLAPREQQTIQRHHAVFEASAKQLPPVQLNGAETSPHAVDVVDAPVQVEAVAVRDGSGTVQARFTIKNDGDRTCMVQRVGIDVSPTGEGEVWVLDNPRPVPAGQQETVTRTVDIPPETAFSREMRVALVTCKQGGTEQNYQTLAPLVRPDDGGKRSEVGRVTLLEKTQLVADTPGAVEIRLENDGSDPLSDATVAVEGDILMPAGLSPDSKTVPQLLPGEETELLVDVKPGSTETTTFTVVIDGNLNGESIQRRVQFEGPVARSAQEWEAQSYIEQWGRRDTVDDERAVEIEKEHLVTRFQPTEAGSHR